ncbi:VanZ family protein [Bacteroidota bacterium]
MIKSSLLIGIFWAIVILLLSLLPSRNINKLVPFNMLFLDKIVHFFMYSILSLLFYSAIRNKAIFLKKQLLSYFLIFIFISIYGGLLELIQNNSISGRTPDIMDFVANSIGAISGLLIYSPLKRFIKYIQNKL